jgi:hypothetical protein
MTGFTYADYESIFCGALDNGFRSITLRQYFENAYAEGEKLLVNRIDVDIKIERLPRIAEILQKHGICTTVFLRLHSPHYNLLSFGNIQIVRNLIEAGNEIGIHTELMDASGYCQINAERLLRRENGLFEALFDYKVYGSASHGDITRFNNLDFWKTHRPADFGLLYEAYDKALWESCRYVSDSEWTRWKAYNNGKIMENDRRTPIEHMRDSVDVLYLLTHPESWYHKYIYE